MERFVSARIIFTFEFNMLISCRIPKKNVYSNEKEKLIFQTNSLTFLLKENAIRGKKSISPCKKSETKEINIFPWDCFYVYVNERI